MTTPTCPACGTKFSHSIALARCKKCGLPDEVAAQGGRAVARWKRTAIVHPADPQQAQALRPHGERAAQKARKHGRPRGKGGISPEDSQNPISSYRKMGRAKRNATSR